MERPGVERKQHQRAGLLVGVPGLHRVDGGAVPHQHGVHPVSQQPLGQLGVVPASGDVVAERAEDAAGEPVAGGEERRGGRGQSHAVALQLLERVAPGRHLRQRLLGPAAVRAVHGLLLARLGHQVTGVLRVGRGPLGFVAQETGALHRVIAPALRVGQLPLETRAVRTGAGRPLAQRGQLAFERRALALEGPQRLRLRLQLLLPLPDLGALLAEPAADVLLGLGPPGQLAADALVLHGGGIAVPRRGVALHQGLLHPEFHLTPLLLRPVPAGGGVGKPLGGEGQIAVELADLHPDGAEAPGDLGSLPFGGGPLASGSSRRCSSSARRWRAAGRSSVRSVIARLHARRIRAQLLEQPPGERHLKRELLLGELDGALRLAALARQAPDLRLHLGDEVLDALEVGRGFLQPALGAVLPVAIEPDARRLLEQRPALVGAVGEQQVDHLGLDHDAGVAAESGAAEQVLDVAQPDGRAVEQVVALAASGRGAG